jgi:PST family polysaccharide transporter
MNDPHDRHGALERLVARGAGVGLASGVVAQLVLLSTYVLLARLAAPEVFGTFAAASILVAIGGLFIESGMTAALVHRGDRIEEATATAFLATLASGVTLTILSAALAPVVGAIFDDDEITTVAFAIAGVHLLNALHVVPNALLQRQFAYVRKALTEPVALTVYGVVAAVGLVVGWGVWALAAATYLSGVARVILVWTLLWSRPRLRLASFAMWRELAAYARHVLAGEILRHAGMIAHTLGIGRFLSTQELGQFNFGNQIARQAGAPIVTGAANVLFPAFARIADDARRLAEAFRRALTSLCFVTIPLSFGMLAFGESLAVLLLGERWQPAGEVLSSLGLVGAALAVISISTELLKAIGRPQFLPRIHLLSALAPIAAVAAGLPFGIVAIGALTSFGLSLVAVFALRLTSREIGLGMRTVAAAVVPTLGAAAIVGAAFFLVEHRFVKASSHGVVLGFALLGLEAGVAALCYLGLMRIAAPQATREVLGSLRHLARTRKQARGLDGPSAKSGEIG